MRDSHIAQYILYTISWPPKYINKSTIDYHLKGTSKEGIYTTDGIYVNRTVRSPSWSPDGKNIVYEKTEWNIRRLEKKLYSWLPDWETRFVDVFPQFNYAQNRYVMTEKQLGNSFVVSLNPDGSDEKLVYNNMESGLIPSFLVSSGVAGAFQPAWSPDGEWVVFGEGAWFQWAAGSFARQPTVLTMRFWPIALSVSPTRDDASE
ncbi:hypothetical protein CBS63078_8312 [Aspergillus niger]|nr:hypothetical protein CBS63078_8312 [Aspergillus niger]